MMEASVSSMDSTRITLFTNGDPQCPNCRAAKDDLRYYGVPFREIPMDPSYDHDYDMAPLIYLDGTHHIRGGVPELLEILEDVYGDSQQHQMLLPPKNGHGAAQQHQNSHAQFLEPPMHHPYPHHGSDHRVHQKAPDNNNELLRIRQEEQDREIEYLKDLVASLERASHDKLTSQQEQHNKLFRELEEENNRLRENNKMFRELKEENHCLQDRLLHKDQELDELRQHILLARIKRDVYRQYYQKQVQALKTRIRKAGIEDDESDTTNKKNRPKLLGYRSCLPQKDENLPTRVVAHNQPPPLKQQQQQQQRSFHGTCLGTSLFHNGKNKSGKDNHQKRDMLRHSFHGHTKSSSLLAAVASNKKQNRQQQQHSPQPPLSNASSGNKDNLQERDMARQSIFDGHAWTSSTLSAFNNKNKQPQQQTLQRSDTSPPETSPSLTHNNKGSKDILQKRDMLPHSFHGRTTSSSLLAAVASNKKQNKQLQKQSPPKQRSFHGTCLGQSLFHDHSQKGAQENRQDKDMLRHSIHGHSTEFSSSSSSGFTSNKNQPPPSSMRELRHSYHHGRSSAILREWQLQQLRDEENFDEDDDDDDDDSFANDDEEDDHDGDSPHGEGKEPDDCNGTTTKVEQQQQEGADRRKELSAMRSTNRQGISKKQENNNNMSTRFGTIDSGGGDVNAQRTSSAKRGSLSSSFRQPTGSSSRPGFNKSSDRLLSFKARYAHQGPCSVSSVSLSRFSSEGESENSDLIQMPLNQYVSVLEATRELLRIVPVADMKYNRTTYRNSFKGTALADAFQEAYKYTRQEAEDLGRSLYESNMLYHVCNAHGYKDNGYFYRLHCHHTPQILNSLCIWKDKYTQLLHWSEVATRIMDKLRVVLDSLCDTTVAEAITTTDDTDNNNNKQQPQSQRPKKINYSREKDRSLMEELDYEVCQFQMVQLARLGRTEILAFGLDVFQIFLHYAFLKVGVPVSGSAYASFWTDLKFNVGGEVYSFHEWWNGICRGNRKGPFGSKPFQGKDNRRYILFPKVVDPRIHFVAGESLLQGRMFNFDAENLESILESIAKSHCKSSELVSIQHDSGVVTLSSIFQTNLPDFAPSVADLPKAMSTWLWLPPRDRIYVERRLTGDLKLKVEFHGDVKCPGWDQYVGEHISFKTCPKPDFKTVISLSSIGADLGVTTAISKGISRTKLLVADSRRLLLDDSMNNLESDERESDQLRSSTSAPDLLSLSLGISNSKSTGLHSEQ